MRLRRCRHLLAAALARRAPDLEVRSACQSVARLPLRQEESEAMTNDLPIRKFDQEMLAALTRLGFEIEDGGHSAYAECGVLIGNDMDFRIQMVTDNGARVSFRRVTREQILSAAKAVDPEDAAVFEVGGSTARA
jgi:hypothetical protein